MKDFYYDYTICSENSPKVFKAACELIHKTFPNIHMDELLVDVDGSTIQCFMDSINEIIVYDDYDVGAVYVKSDIDLSHLLHSAKSQEEQTVIGLRTRESEKFTRYFSLVQAEAAKQGYVFFVDAGDGNDFETAEMEGEELMGWLIPKNEADEFNSFFKAHREIPSKWDDTFCWAEWSRDNGSDTVSVAFRFYE